MSAEGLIRSSAPGRICLFGEHLDYLGLPVIAAAIDLRIWVEGGEAAKRGWIIRKPDLDDEEDRFLLGPEPIPHSNEGEADFLRAAINVVRREGVSLPPAAEFHVTGRIPIRAGTSSSSALQVAWVAALLALAEDERAGRPEAIARLAFLSEVPEFNGSGGMMDQFTSALGGLVRIDPDKSDPVQRLSVMLGRFVLGHSREPKDTQAMLARVQSAARRGALWLENQMGEFSWRTTTIDQVEGFLGKADGQDQDLRVTLGALRNRDILEEGHQLLTSREVDHTRLGALLTEHHRVLRDSLEISTPKIERMLDAALGAGALGGKINGSGGGGCMFVYAPNAPEEVAKAIRAAGGDAWIIEVATGVEVVISRQPDVDVSDPIAHHGLG